MGQGEIRVAKPGPGGGVGEEALVGEASLRSRERESVAPALSPATQTNGTLDQDGGANSR